MQAVLKALCKISTTIISLMVVLLCYSTPATAATATAAAATAAAATAADFPFTQPQFERVSDADAIDNQIITALAQDARGLIWIGTQGGLVRYDGYRFRKFAHKASDPFSLAGDFIFSLSVAKDGRVWVGTISDGISVFDPASERFEHFRHDEKAPDSLGGGRISALVGDERGGMWIATEQGLNYLPVSERRFVHFRHSTDPHSLMDDKVRSLLLDKAGRLWVGSSSGLQRLSQDGKRFETVVTGKNVLTLFQAQDGKVWLGTREHGAAWLNSSQVHWLPLAQLSHPWITGIAQIKTDQIWLATYGGGIIVIAASDGHVQQTLRHDPALASSLALDMLKPLLMDRAGWLWIGIFGAGLQRMNANNTMLRVLRHSLKRPDGLSHPDVRSVLELANGQLLIGSNGNGIDIFDRQRGLIGGYRKGEGLAGGLPDASVYALAQTGDGTVWAGTQQAGVVRQLASGTAWAPVPGLPVKQVNKLLASRDGSLWAGTNRGVARWQPGAQPPARFEAVADERGKAMEFAVNALAEDGQGRIWIGTDNGLWLHEPGRSGLIFVPADPNRPDGLVSDHILGLLFDSRGRLWVSTDKGLARLKNRDGKSAQFEHISALSGGAEKTLGENLLEDRQGRIWTGAAVIDPVIRDSTKMRITPLTLADGMDIGANWLGSYAQTRDGLLLYGGTKGMAIIDPARFKAYDYAPPLVATELKINGEAVAPAMLATPLAHLSEQASSGTAASLTLDPAQRNFALEFAALDYAEPKKNRYQYRLQGYEKNWINTDADHRSATYGNLWPGLYTLQVRGSNRMGDWSVHELRIPIRVLPAWWQTWWFGVVLLLGMTALITALVQTRTHYLRKRQHELEEQVQTRTRELHQKHTELAQSHTILAETHSELAATHLNLQETQQQLVLQEKMAGLGTLTAGVAHQINNPTNFVHVSAQIQQIDIAEFEEFVAGLIEADGADGAPEVLAAFRQRFAKLSKNVSTMLSGTERIIGIVKDLRSFTRQGESARKIVRLSECLLSTVNLVRTIWLEKVEFITEFTDDPELECWPALLNQVFMNLLLNGCQAIEEKHTRAALQDGQQDGEPSGQRGKLWLRLHLNPARDALMIVFEDSGTGIDPAIQARIMEPFFTTKEVGSGSGLGLSTAFGIVQKHGGSLEFTSTPGEGSCFTVTLPLPGAQPAAYTA